MVTPGISFLYWLASSWSRRSQRPVTTKTPGHAQVTVSPVVSITELTVVNKLDKQLKATLNMVPATRLGLAISSVSVGPGGVGTLSISTSPPTTSPELSFEVDKVKYTDTVFAVQSAATNTGTLTIVVMGHCADGHGLYYTASALGVPTKVACALSDTPQNVASLQLLERDSNQDHRKLVRACFGG